MFYISPQLEGTGRNSLEKNFKTREPPYPRPSTLNRISYIILDITTGSNLLREMRSLCGNEKALPPQIFHGTEYLGVSLFSKDKKRPKFDFFRSLKLFRTIKQVLIISRQDKY